MGGVLANRDSLRGSFGTMAERAGVNVIAIDVVMSKFEMPSQEFGGALSRARSCRDGQPGQALPKTDFKAGWQEQVNVQNNKHIRRPLIL